MISLKGNGNSSVASFTNKLDAKEDKGSSMTAQQKEKLFGKDGDIGDLLNGLSDSNYIPLKKRRAGVGGGNNEMGKDAFMKLMITQLQNQDPTNTMESHEMAAQMAQFTSLEKLTNIDQSIKGIGGAKGASGAAGSYDSLQMIGKVVSGDSSKIFRSEGDESHDFGFSLKADAQNVVVEIQDGAGNVVRSYEINDLKKGANSVNWNGKTAEGMDARQGEYRFKIMAKDSSGKKIHAETKFEGQISGVQFTAQGQMLLLGKQQIRLSDVKKIIDPRFLNNKNMESDTKNSTEQKSKKAVIDLSEKGKEIYNNKIGAGSGGNIKDVPMSRGLINKLADRT